MAEAVSTAAPEPCRVDQLDDEDFDDEDFDDEDFDDEDLDEVERDIDDYKSDPSDSRTEHGVGSTTRRVPVGIHRFTN